MSYKVTGRAQGRAWYRKDTLLFEPDFRFFKMRSGDTVNWGTWSWISDNKILIELPGQDTVFTNILSVKKNKLYEVKTVYYCGDSLKIPHKHLFIYNAIQ